MVSLRRDERGFALVAVLWILVFVGVLGVAFQADARAERRAAANARAASRARWAARAALAWAIGDIDRMLEGRAGAPVLRTVGDTVIAPVEFSGAGVSGLAIALDCRARVQLNLADEEALQRLFVNLGIRVSQARRLADAIIDWRDADPVRRPHGAEAGDYATRRPPVRPRNAPFESIDELQDVAGMNRELYLRVAPYLSAAGDGRVNVNAAPVPVLMTLPGIDSEAALAIVARRRSGPYRSSYQLLTSLPRASREWIESEMDQFVERVAFTAGEVEIVATGNVAGSPVGAQLRALVLLSGGSSWSVERVVER